MLTAIEHSRLRYGDAHRDLALAVEEDAEEDEAGKEEDGTALKKSNDPRLAGGESHAILVLSHQWLVECIWVLLVKTIQALKYTSSRQLNIHPHHVHGLLTATCSEGCRFRSPEAAMNLK